MRALNSAQGATAPKSRGLFEVRFHGRGGQGTVIASILLAQAAFHEGRGVQAFPFFGVERRGAPVVAHARIGDGPVRLACEVRTPDVVVVMDPSLLAGLGSHVAKGLRPQGVLLLNSKRTPHELRELAPQVRIATVDASGIARRHKLGSSANPIVNTSMLGAAVGVTKIVGFDSLEAAIKYKVPANIDGNIQAARDGAAEVKVA